jgi:hypothetical protein
MRLNYEINAYPFTQGSSLISRREIILKADQPISLYFTVEQTAIVMAKYKKQEGMKAHMRLFVACLSALDHFWEKEQTKADVEVFILDEVFSGLPTPPFTAEEKKKVAANVYSHSGNRQ